MMTVNELKQWLEGYLAGIGDREATSKDFAVLVKKIQSLGLTSTPKLTPSIGIPPYPGINKIDGDGKF